jgi:hypothetical protein
VEKPVPLPDVVLESDRVLDAAAAAEVTVRLLGGVAVAKHIHGDLAPELTRNYGDIDLIAMKRDARRLREVLIVLGYEPNKPFNSLHGDRRLQYFDVENQRHLDVFVEVFEMCHKLESFSLSQHPQTLTPTDLLLTKLQVVQVTEKDLIDAATLLLQHAVADHPGDVIDVQQMSEVVRRDWGWYITVQDNLSVLAEFPLQSAAAATDLSRKISLITGRLNAAPKTMKWKARARIGRRVPWYISPEEPNQPTSVEP